MTTTTTTITQNQALCMLFGLEFNKINVKKCREEVGSRAIMGFNCKLGDQIPQLFIPEQIARHPTLFTKYADDVVEKKEEEEIKKEEKTEKRKEENRLLYYWTEVADYLNKVYKAEDPKDEKYVKETVEIHEIFDETCPLVHSTLTLGNTWKVFGTNCNKKMMDFTNACATRGKTSPASELFVLKKEYRDQVVTDVLSVLKEHRNTVTQFKEDGMEIIGYARKSLGSKERKRRYENLESMSKLLLRHSMCDQVFVSPESECSQSLNDRDLDSNFVGNTTDMVGYITTCNHQVCLVVLDYAGLCSRGNLVKSFLERHPNIEKVVVDLYSSENQFIMLDSSEIIRDPSKFSNCRIKLVNRSK